MPERMDDLKALAHQEAMDIIAEFGAGDDPGRIEKLADSLMTSLKSYDQGSDFGRQVIRELRLIARETRKGIA